MGKRSERINFTKGVIGGLPTPDKPTRYYDEKVPGLILRVLPSGNKTFYFRKRSHGKLEEVRIGQFPDMPPEAARDSARKMAAEAAEGRDPAAAVRARRNDLTFGELFAWYMEHHAKPHTRTHKEIARWHKLYMGPLDKKHVSAITRADIRNLHAQVGAKVIPSANKLLKILRAVFNQGIKHELFAGPNPTQGITFFREQSRDRRLMPDEVARFLGAVQQEPNETIRDYVMLSLLTGARKANVLAMRWDEIDWIGATWRIPRTKTDTAQTVPLGEPEMAILRRRLELVGGSPWVLPGGPGAIGHLRMPYRGWKRICQRAEIADLHIHDLRRTLGSWMVDTGASLAVIGKALNHQSQATTAIYARLSLDPVREAKDKAIAALLEAGKEKPRP